MMDLLMVVTSRLTVLEENLRQAGAFESDRIVIIGNNSLSDQLASLFTNQRLDVFLFRGSASKKVIERDKLKCFSLNIASLKRNSSNIKDSQFFIFLSCAVEMLEELLFIVSPFSHVIIIGPIEGVLENLDIYSTIHYKNLDLMFLPSRDLNVP